MTSPTPPDQKPLRVLALEPYYGGSHRAFLDGWIAESRHDWTLLTLPAHHWKWRMRHAPMTFAEQLGELSLGSGQEAPWDVLFATDMLDLPQLIGLAPPSLAPPGLARLPRVLYFHENQLTYPARTEDARDLHFGVTNAISALAADRVWFNSAYHRDTFLDAVDELFRRMPDYAPHMAAERIRSRSRVEPPGVKAPGQTVRLRIHSRRAASREEGPTRIAWAARWEHDKNPELFFAALDRLASRGAAFEVSVLGQSFRSVPEVFAQARERLGERVRRWGYLETREEYLGELAAADLFVSTADHEFFGLSAVEAMSAGAFPLLPRRLAYPELLAALPAASRERFLYSGGAEELANRLVALVEEIDAHGTPWNAAGPGPLESSPDELAATMQRFWWKQRAPSLDEALCEARSGGRPQGAGGR